MPDQSDTNSEQARIEGDQMTTFDFGDGNGPVPAHRHTNGGGWVSDTALVSDNALVSDTARVSGNARVSDNARVSGNALVFGDAQVSDNADMLCGRVRGLTWTATRDKGGVLTLQFGCETLPLADWKKQRLALCKKHNRPDCAEPLKRVIALASTLKKKRRTNACTEM